MHITQAAARKLRDAGPPSSKQTKLVKRLLSEKGLTQRVPESFVEASRLIDRLMRTEPASEKQVSYLKSLYSELEEPFRSPESKADAQQRITTLVARVEAKERAEALGRTPKQPKVKAPRKKHKTKSGRVITRSLNDLTDADRKRLGLAEAA